MNRKTRHILQSLMGRRRLVQTAALCVRPGDGHVLLITSRDTGRWVLPKGWPMRGLTLPEAALIEAWEEAGVTGVINPVPVGHVKVMKNVGSGVFVPVTQVLHQVDVTSVSDEFPEAGQRRLIWMPKEEASASVIEPELSRIISALP